MPQEGKTAFTFGEVAVALAATTLLAGDSRFLHLFLLLCFNMIARADTTGHLRYDFLSWNNDHAVVKVPKTKADQSGEMGFPKSIFANPHDATLCPFVALGLHIYTNLSPTNGRVFQNGISKAVGPAFRSFLTTTMPLSLAAFDPEDHGTHSLRKGAVTYATGFPGGPNTVAVYLRANWSLGTVKDRYVSEFYLNHHFHLTDLPSFYLFYQPVTLILAKETMNILGEYFLA